MSIVMTRTLTTADELLIMEAINDRPDGVTVEADMNNVGYFAVDYAVGCLELYADKYPDRNADVERVTFRLCNPRPNILGPR